MRTRLGRGLSVLLPVGGAVSDEQLVARVDAADCFDWYCEAPKLSVEARLGAVTWKGDVVVFPGAVRVVDEAAREVHGGAAVHQPAAVCKKPIVRIRIAVLCIVIRVVGERFRGVVRDSAANAQRVHHGAIGFFVTHEKQPQACVSDAAGLDDKTIYFFHVDPAVRKPLARP